MASNATHLRVTFTTAPPYNMAGRRNGKVYVAGIFGMIFQALADYVPFSYNIVYDSRLSFGVRLENGSYNGIMGLVERGDVDLAASPMLLREDRTHVSAYGPFLYASECGLIAVAGEPSINVFSYLFVFEWEVWALLVACIPLVSAALAFIETRRIRNTNSIALEIYDNTWDILRSFSYEGHPFQARTHAGRLLFSIWWLTVLVLTNGFAGQLKASMAIKSEPPRFRSAEDITSHPSIRPIMWRDTAFEAYVRTSSRPLLKALTRQVYRYGGPVFITEMFSEQAMEQLYRGQAVIISDRTVTLYMLAKQCRLTGGRLYVAPDLLFTRFVSMVYSKKIPPDLERRIHRKMRAIMESGLHLKWLHDGMKEWHDCEAMQAAGRPKSSELSFKELSYDDMTAMFALWVIMAGLSLMVFLLELCVHQTEKNHRYRLARIAARRNAHRYRQCGAQAPSPVV